MKQEIYWHTTATMPDDSNLNPVPPEADFAIIGGGFTGLSAARTLAKAGAKAVVLEAETVGWGASSRNGGMVLPGLKVSMRTALRKYGRELARDLFRYSLDSVITVENLVREENIDCGFDRYGHLQVATKQKHYEDMKHEVEFMAKEFNHKLRLVPPEELNEEIGSNIYHGGLVDVTGGGLNPAQYLAGLAKTAEQAGATLCARARVTKLERNQNRFVIETERGVIHAKSVLVATSGYTSGVTMNLKKRIIPIGSFIIATEKLSDELARELGPHNRMIVDSMHFLNYYRVLDNRMIFGGRAAFFPENQNTINQSGEILRQQMVKIYPQLKDVKVEYVWGGTLDFAFDQMTHVGEMDELYYSLGYAGHGVAMATHLGMTVAQAMLNGNIKDHPFSKFNFPAAPFGINNGKPWFLPLAAAWYRFLDIIH